MQNSNRPALRRPHAQSKPSRMVSSALTIYLQQLAQKEPAMNRYALMAQEHWKKYAPNRYAALEHPETFFEELGESAQAQVDQAADAMESQIPQDLPYLERVGQLRAARMQAEEIALQDLVYSVEPESTDLGEELADLVGSFPTPAMLENSIRRIEDQVKDEASDRQAEGEPYVEAYTDDQLALIAKYRTLIPLLTLTQDEAHSMTEAEQRDRILALQPFWDHQSGSMAQ